MQNFLLNQISFKRKILVSAITLCCLQASVVTAETSSAATPADEAKAAEQKQSLPSPLTLDALFADFSKQAPEFTIQQAQIQAAEANLSANQVEDNLELNVVGRLGRREFAEENLPHNMLALHLGKVIYDFGQSQTRLDADTALVQQQQVLLELEQNQQKLRIAQAFMNVLLSDFQYRIDNEAMAIDYINYDKVQDRHEIGQLSDVDLLEAEHNYQKSLLQRSKSEQAQLRTRVELANTINLPQARPDELKFPDLKALQKRSIKAFSLDEIQADVLQSNPQLNALKLALEAQQLVLQNAANSKLPSVRADAWVGQLSSQPEVREGRWRAEITVDVPLYDGGAEKSRVATAKAELMRLQGEYNRLAQGLRSQVAELYFQLKLLDTEKKVHQAFGDYADLYLDFSRALYENETTTDLGDSFVRLSQANYDMVAWEFKQALLWMQLDYLLGNEVSLTTHESSKFIVAETAQ